MEMTGYGPMNCTRTETANGAVRDVRVVVGFGESFSAPEVVWSLADRGFEVLAFARKGSFAALRYSRYANVFDLTPPEKDTRMTVHELSESIDRLLRLGSARLVLMALDDVAIWLFRQLRPNARVILPGIAGDGSDFVLDKAKQIEAAREAGFSVPATAVLRSVGPCVGSKVSFPLMLKPRQAVSVRDGVASRGRLHLCHSPVQLREALATVPHGETVLAQQYITGTGEGLFGLASHAGVLAWSGHRRIRMMNPMGSGASACMSTIPRPEDVGNGERLVRRIAWRGPFMIELLRDGQGKTWFMEFNGRIWGSTALGRRCGLEYPAWAVLDALRQEAAIPAKPQPKVGVTCRHAGRETVHALMVMRGCRSKVPTGWPSRSTTIRQLLSFRKAQYWYNWRRDDWRVFVADVLATIMDNVFKSRKLR